MAALPACVWRRVRVVRGVNEVVGQRMRHVLRESKDLQKQLQIGPTDLAGSCEEL
jgi:hypothetical protein